MKLRLLHRRLTVLMGLSALLAFAGGAGFEPIAASLAAVALVAALFWQPDEELSLKLEHVWMPVAVLLVLRALWHLFMVGDDIVIPVVDLLLLLLAAECLRSLEAPNDVRLYALSFALLLASTAYRPGLLFGVAFIAYVGLATVALMVGHLRRQGERHGRTDVRLGRQFLTATAALSGVTLTVSALVFVSFPRVSRGWAGRGSPPMASIVGFSDEVSLGSHGSRIWPNPQIVLRVEFPEGAPSNTGNLRWRGRSYDHFDGVRWSKSRNLPPSTAPTRWYRERWQGPAVEQEIYALALNPKVLFTLHPVVGVEADSRIQPLFDNAGDFTYWGSAAPVYTAESMARAPEPEALREARGGFTPARSFYTQLPQLPERVHALADSLTEGLDNDYDKARAIEQWFHDEFQYTLELPATQAQATVDHFLFERRAGHCEYFSTAMAVLLRSAGVPVRNVNGFLGGDWSDFGSYLAVTQNQAHSWVEVWFPGHGWVAFDPTPAGGGTGEASTTWFWPGRILFDGLQHRWSKWVLDYSVTEQDNLLSRLSNLFGGEEDSGPVGTGDAGSEGLGLLGGVAVILVLGALVVIIIRKDRHLPPEARIYKRLRRRYEKKGLPGAEELPPLAFLERVRESDLGGLAQARKVVALYLKARFADEEIGDEGRREMSAALAGARRSLRRTG